MICFRGLGWHDRFGLVIIQEPGKILGLPVRQREVSMFDDLAGCGVRSFFCFLGFGVLGFGFGSLRLGGRTRSV